MGQTQRVFQIHLQDNVATALAAIRPGSVTVLGDVALPEIGAVTEIPEGHKIALRNIREGDDILKYGVVIGRATRDIPAGSWVHLHVMRSIYDERSSHLDGKTGAPKDTCYE